MFPVASIYTLSKRNVKLSADRYKAILQLVFQDLLSFTFYVFVIPLFPVYLKLILNIYTTPKSTHLYTKSTFM